MDQGNLSQSDQETQNVSKDRAGIKDGESRSAISDDEDASQTPDDDFSKKFGVGLEEKASKVQEDLTKKHEFDTGNRMFKLTFKNGENEDVRTLGDVFKIDEESVIDRGSMENFTENRKYSRNPNSPFEKDGNILTDDDDVNGGRIGARKESGGLLRDKLGDIRKERASNNASEYEGSSGGLGSQKLYTPPPVARDPFTWITGSVYDGTWDLLGMSGRGSYTMPHAKRNFVENVPDDWSQVSITRSNVMLVCLPSLLSANKVAGPKRRVGSIGSHILRGWKLLVTMWNSTLNTSDSHRPRGWKLLVTMWNSTLNTSGSHRLRGWKLLANDCNKVWRLLGVVYEGALKDGKFHGKGTLNYPSGCCISGVWDNGVLQSTSFHFSDGLSFRNVESWKYCKMPDRRFYKEHLLGLRPAGLSHLTQDTPTRPIPEGCYDVGDGFYDPRTKCVTDPEDGRITRVPTAAEEEWIMANCRKAWDQPQGYRPDLYENWWSEQGCKAGDQEEEEDLQ
uniref:MORN repeat-containing protein 5 n=1 Tax=Timema poppense TaxID=170557 RepID=A0A7R9CJ14_TIMPO|nr:unnamed protein product [Timema poppensis]